MTKNIKRYNQDVYSIFEGEDFFGSVLKLTSGLWKVVDKDEKRIDGVPLLKKPKDALKYFDL